MDGLLARLAAWLLPVSLSTIPGAANAQEADAADRWRFHLEELEVMEAWARLSRDLRPEPFALEHVTLIDVRAGTRLPDRTVRVRGDAIEWVGPADEANVAGDERRLDGRGRFLMPGLVDMHTHHLTSCSHPLLELACGVTTVREMCGFPWLLEWRARVAAGDLLAPDLFVAGHILNAMPMGTYATVVTAPEEARRAVAAQAAAGYDFIKVHNVLPLELYRAVFAAAREAGLPVVGHVPHEVTLAEAFAQGQATLEHFKGYLLDRTLELTEEDYVELTRASRPFLCPTLTTFRIGLAGEEAERFLREAPGMRYVSVFDRAHWLDLARGRSPENSHARIHALSRAIFVDLLDTGACFLTGTDSGGGYEFLVPGFALQDEIEEMESLGLPTAEVLRAATLHPAEALGREGRQGEVVAGQRANLLLLGADPLASARNVRAVAGVAVRGTWLAREKLDEVLATLERVMAHGGDATPPSLPEGEGLGRFVERMEALGRGGQVFMTHSLEEIATLLEAADRARDAGRIRALAARSGAK